MVASSVLGMDLIDILDNAGERWMDDGACTASVVDIVAFTSPSDDVEAAEAVAMCRTCPVILECRAYATSNGETGVWGGLWLRREGQARRGA